MKERLIQLHQGHIGRYLDGKDIEMRLEGERTVYVKEGTVKDDGFVAAAATEESFGSKQEQR